MAIRFYKGDILESKCEVICTTVNCVGAMGKGLAAHTKIKWPAVNTKYQELCKQGLIKPGEPRLITVKDQDNNDIKILLCPTKDDWRNDSKMEWIDEILKRISQNIDKFNSIAIPPLGCGNGNLVWYAVLNRIMEHLENVDCEIHIYPPQ